MNETACPEEMLLSRFLERVSLPEEQASVSAHLERCTSCQRALALLPEPGQSARGGEVRLGPYRLGPELGRGPRGTLHLGHDTRLGRAVELLLAQPAPGQTRDQLLEQARALARVTHPSVVPIFEVNVTGEQVWLAMAHLEGVSLEAWLAQRRRAPAEVLERFGQVASALEAAHALGCAHGGVSLANVRVAGDGLAHLLDFSLSGAASPEADQLAFSLALTEALTGARPAVGARVRWPSPVPPRVRAALNRALAREPSARFPSMHALREALAWGPGTGWLVGWKRALLLVGAVGLILVSIIAMQVSVASGLGTYMSPPLGQVLDRARGSVVMVVASVPGQPTQLRAGLLVPRGARGLVLTTASGVAGSQLAVLRHAEGAVPAGGAQDYAAAHRGDALEARLVLEDPVTGVAVLELAGDYSSAPRAALMTAREERFIDPRWAALWPDERDDVAALEPDPTRPPPDLQIQALERLPVLLEQVSMRTVVALGHPDDQPWGQLSGRLTSLQGDLAQVSITSSDGLAGGPVMDKRGRIWGLMRSDSSAPRGSSVVVTARALDALLDQVAPEASP